MTWSSNALVCVKITPEFSNSNPIRLRVCLFVLIWASQGILVIDTGLLHLACLTWRLGQKFPKRIALSLHFMGSKGFWLHAPTISSPPGVERRSASQGGLHQIFLFKIVIHGIFIRSTISQVSLYTMGLI